MRVENRFRRRRKSRSGPVWSVNAPEKSGASSWPISRPTMSGSVPDWDKRKREAVEAKNQARVHLWYERWFGYPYTPLQSARHGIERFLVPCTCVGLQPGNTSQTPPLLYAPYGLAELYAGLMRPNPACPHLPLFQAKAESYRERWPWLTIQPMQTATGGQPENI